MRTKSASAGEAGAPHEARGAAPVESSNAEAAANSGRDEEPDRRRDHEARVRRVEHDPGRRECVQREEARGGEKGERDEEEPCVGAAPRAVAGDDREHHVHERGGEDEPEVGGVMLPDAVDVGDREQEHEPDERDREEPHPHGAPHAPGLHKRAPSAASSSAR